MKKFLLVIGLSVLSFATFAEKVPTVVVNKGQGGWTAILNMYNYVTYTPAELTPTGVGQLDCSGIGFTACRLPNCTSLNVNNGNVVYPETDNGKLNAFRTAINDVISQFEAAQEHATAEGSQGNVKGIPSTYTKTLSFSSPSKGGPNKKSTTYVVRGVVTSSAGNSSTMKIYIEQANILNVGQ